MQLDVAHGLLSSSGRDLLAMAARLLADRVEPARALNRLRQGAPADLAAAAWEMADLRRRAVAKFGDAATDLFFIREALEQASGARAAAYHASRLGALGRPVLDIGAGIGADSLAFAAAGMDVVAIERDPVRALFLRANTDALGLGDRIRVVAGDIEECLQDGGGLPIGGAVAWLDPDRRPDGRRTSDPYRCDPPISLLTRLLGAGAVAAGAKLSPAVDLDIGPACGGSLEIVSDGGECKEALLWLGALRGQNGPPAATVLSEHGPMAFDPSALTLGEGDDCLFEPDPSVIRAGRVDELADAIGATAVHPSVPYLIGPRTDARPFAAAYPIVMRMPYHPKKLQQALAARGAGRVVVKKRGVDVDPAQVERALSGKGGGQAVVVLYRDGRRIQAVVCEPPWKGPA